MLCCSCPLLNGSFGGEGRLLLLGGGLAGAQVHSGKVRGGVGRLRYSGGLMVWCKRHLGGEDSVCGKKRVTPMFYRRIVVGPNVGLGERSSL